MKKCRKILSWILILFFMTAMPSTFGCGPRIKDEEVTNEVPVESGPIEEETIDDYYDYDLHDYDNSGYVKPHLRGDTRFPTIRDVSKLLRN